MDISSRLLIATYLLMSIVLECNACLEVFWRASIICIAHRHKAREPVGIGPDKETGLAQLTAVLLNVPMSCRSLRKHTKIAKNGNDISLLTLE